MVLWQMYMHSAWKMFHWQMHFHYTESNMHKSLYIYINCAANCSPHIWRYCSMEDQKFHYYAGHLRLLLCIEVYDMVSFEGSLMVQTQTWDHCESIRHCLGLLLDTRRGHDPGQALHSNPTHIQALQVFGGNIIINKWAMSYSRPCW